MDLATLFLLLVFVDPKMLLSLFLPCLLFLILDALLAMPFFSICDSRFAVPFFSIWDALDGCTSSIWGVLDGFFCFFADGILIFVFHFWPLFLRFKLFLLDLHALFFPRLVCFLFLIDSVSTSGSQIRFLDYYSSLPDVVVGSWCLFFMISDGSSCFHSFYRFFSLSFDLGALFLSDSVSSFLAAISLIRDVLALSCFFFSFLVCL